MKQKQPPLSRCMTEFERREVDYLWRPYIPSGMLTILEGDPGVGKSQIVAAIAASLSVGNGLPGEPERDPSRSLIFSAEDDPRCTLGPRLDRLGADSSRIFFCGCFSLLESGAMERLLAEVCEREPAFVVFDPIQAFLGGGVDMYRANEVRAVLAPLAELAEASAAAVVINRHLGKSRPGRGLHAGLGSVDFVAAARSVLLAGSSADDPQDRGLLHMKSNVGPLASALSYRIGPDGAFSWNGASALRAGDILGAETEEGQSRREEAEEFLREVLADGPKAANEVQAAAKQSGIAWRTVERVRQALGVEVRKSGFLGGWRWSLPPAPKDEAAKAA